MAVQAEKTAYPLNAHIFPRSVERRALLICKIPVPMYLRHRELCFKSDQQQHQRLLLLQCSGVLRLPSVCSQAANVAHTDGVGVVTLAMRPHLGQWPPLMDAAVTVDDVMVADGLEATLLVPPCDVVDGVVLAIWRGRAVHYDFVNRPHVVISCLVADKIQS